MTSSISAWTKEHSLLLYFLLAYAISWALEIPLALAAQGLSQTHIPFSIHYLAAYGPMLSAITVTWLADGSSGLRELFGRMVKWRVQPIWWLVAFSPLVLYALVAIVLRVIQGQWLDSSLLGQVDFLPNLGVGALFLRILTYGIGEETGWRGFALPRLQRGRSAWSATLILWVFWAIWHVPSFFYLHTVADAGSLAGFLLGVLAGAILFTWLYNSGRGSILIVALWHGLFDFTTACTECKAGMIAPILSTLVMVWAILAVFLFKPGTLSHAEKQVV